MPNFTALKAPTTGTAIVRRNGRIVVPDDPIIPFIEGDGIGRDIWRASVRVLDAAVSKAHGSRRKIAWLEVYAGEKSFKQFNNWLPDDTVEAFREYYVGIKGPLTTPVGGGIRSLNVALRQLLDLYVCLRPVRWYNGVPSPIRHPEKVDMVIFRENTEDIYAGIEYTAGSPDSQKVLDFFAKEFPKEFKKIRFGTAQAGQEWQKRLEAIGAPAREVGVQVGVGLKPISYLGSERLIHSAISHAIQNKRKSVTLVHKGNIMKFTEGAFRDWGYQIAKSFFGAEEVDGGPWCKIPQGKPGAGTLIKDALAAQVGGIGIAPGGNINYLSGHAVFEATHGTAPKYANQDKVNPGSVILSGEMMLRHMGWNEAADLIVRGMDGAIAARTVTYDFARLMVQEGQQGVKELKTSEFGEAVVRHFS